MQSGSPLARNTMDPIDGLTASTPPVAAVRAHRSALEHPPVPHVDGEAKSVLQPLAILGFAVAEALAILDFVLAFIVR